MSSTNKVVLNDETLIDLTGDTVTENDVAAGVTFHKADGTVAVGTYVGSAADDREYELLIDESNIVLMDYAPDGDVYIPPCEKMLLDVTYQEGNYPNELGIALNNRLCIAFNGTSEEGLARQVKRAVINTKIENGRLFVDGEGYDKEFRFDYPPQNRGVLKARYPEGLGILPMDYIDRIFLNCDSDYITSLKVYGIRKQGIIGFTIKEDEIISNRYIAEEGMTWEEWVNSEYNTDGYKIKDDGFVYTSNDSYVYWDDIDNNILGQTIHSTDLIDPSKQYVL